MLRPHFVPYLEYHLIISHRYGPWEEDFAYARHSIVALEIVPSSARQAMSGRLTGKQLISDDTHVWAIQHRDL